MCAHPQHSHVLMHLQGHVYAVVSTGDLYEISPTPGGRVACSRIAKANEASMLAGIGRRMTNLFGFSDTAQDLHVVAALPLTAAPLPAAAVVLPQAVQLWAVTERRLVDVSAVLRCAVPRHGHALTSFSAHTHTHTHIHSFLSPHLSPFPLPLYTGGCDCGAG